MRCPWCGHAEDRVVDSRAAENDEAIRRRRECLSCGRRFTTFERVERLGLTVIKRDGTREPYVRDKLVAGVRKAFGNREVDDADLRRFADRIEAKIRRKGPEITSQQLGVEVLQGLQRLDKVAYLRFASVYKDFQDIGDFERELGLLLEKKAPAKARGR